MSLLSRSSQRSQRRLEAPGPSSAALQCTLLLACCLAAACGRPAPEPPPAAAPEAPEAPPSPPQAGAIRWIASSSGAGPDSTQASIEADLARVAQLWGPGGRLLFAGGPGSEGVQELDAAAPLGDPLMAELASIFAPRAGRQARYRQTTLPVDAPATREGLLGALQEALTAPGDAPLWLYLGGHGSMGARPDENGVALWGGDTLGVFELAQATAKRRRPLRLVVTTCHAGGFAELIFEDADATRGPASPLLCGIFATTWDRQAGGCDADPDRRNHDGYAVHLLQALEGLDRQGQALPTIDLDKDGQISLLEAHTQATLGSGSLDVPTTTSERWLRHAAPPEGDAAQLALPEEARVIAELSRRLEVAPTLPAVRSRLEGLQQRLLQTAEAERREADAETAAYYRVAATLLARWPLLDDPWHPGFAPLLARHRDAIQRALAEAPEIAAWRDAVRAVDDRSFERSSLEAEIAPWLRLERALESAALAGRLKALGGAPWRRFEALRACERSPTPRQR